MSFGTWMVNKEQNDLGGENFISELFKYHFYL